MSFRLANIDSRAALVDGDSFFDLEEASRGRFGPDLMAAIARFPELHEVDLTGLRPGGLLRDARLGPPVPRPAQVFGVGLNYRSHTMEFGAAAPALPLIFTKFPGAIAGPREDILLRGDQVDWEVELVAVIGRRTKDVSKGCAWKHIAGLTVGQDISDRRLQFAGSSPQFSLGKSFDSYGPIGPVLVSPDAFPNLSSLEIGCRISGELMQSSRTDQMIFGVPRLVEYISSVVTMQPGDIIFTGTPEGVGMARGRFLRDGDIVSSWITGIGAMTNRCVLDRPASQLPTREEGNGP